MHETRVPRLKTLLEWTELYKDNYNHAKRNKDYTLQLYYMGALEVLRRMQFELDEYHEYTKTTKS